MTMQEQLNQYYECVGIAPVASMNTYEEMFSAFKCKKKVDCRDACRGAWNKKEKFLFLPHPEKDSITVSQEYQDGKYHDDRIPRIVVLSLSKPQPWGRPPTWRETLAMVRSLLHPFIASENFPKPGINKENQKEIEKLFVHVRTAKCCSNANEPGKVYANCGGYLGEELSILKPDVIVTQGNKARDMAKQHAFNAIEQVKGLDLERPIAHIVNLKEGNQCVYGYSCTILIF